MEAQVIETRLVYGFCRMRRVIQAASVPWAGKVVGNFRGVIHEHNNDVTPKPEQGKTVALAIRAVSVRTL